MNEKIVEVIMKDIEWHEQNKAPNHFIEAMSSDQAFIAGLKQAIFLIDKTTPPLKANHSTGII